MQNVFPSPEKIVGLKKTFQNAILEYCRDAALNETLDTLSDKRSVSPDDMQATHARVVATSLAVITNLISELPEEELAKHEIIYVDVLGQSDLWSFATHTDAGVRRSIHRLLQTALSKQPVLIEASRKALSTAYIYKGLPSDQSGSASDFVTALNALTSRLPDVWTDSYSGKKPAVSRLKSFLKHGSRSGIAEFWIGTRSLLPEIPEEIWPKSLKESNDLLVSARDGVSRKEERFVASAAWPTFFTLVSICSRHLPEQERTELVQTQAMPIIREYLQPSQETADWSIHGAKTASLVAQAVKIPGAEARLAVEWPKLADQLIDTAKMSQPQQSKDFDRSQLHVAAAGERWAALQRELLAAAVSDDLAAAITVASIKLVRESAKLLRTREGKPYGAAAMVEELLRACGSTLMKDADFRSAVEDLLRSDRCRWMTWPASRHLIRCLFALKGEAFFAELFETALDAAIKDSETADIACRHVMDIFPRNMPDEALQLGKDNAGFQAFVRSTATSSISEQQRSMLAELLTVGALSEETVSHVTSSLVSTVADRIALEDVRSALMLLTELDDKRLHALATTAQAGELLPALIQLEQDHDDQVAHLATAVAGRLSSTNGDIKSTAKYGMLLQNLETVSQRSLSMSALADLFERLNGSESKTESLQDALPSLDVWKKALQATVRPPKPALAILSPLGGAVHLIKPSSAERQPVQVDQEGLSQALRISMYVRTLLLRSDGKAGLAKLDDQWPVLALLYLTKLLAEDNLSIIGTNALWHPASGVNIEAEVLDFVSDVNTILQQHTASMVPDAAVEDCATISGYAQYVQALRAFLPPGEADTPLHYYISLVEAKLASNLYEIHGYAVKQSKGCEAEFKRLRQSTAGIPPIAYFVGHQQPLAGTPALTRACNDIVSSLTDLDFNFVEKAAAEWGLSGLVLLNVILQHRGDALGSIAKQRVIFLMKTLVGALTVVGDTVIKSEVCKLLSLIVPGIAEMYGEHWGQMLEYLTTFWSSAAEQPAEGGASEEHILLINASLKLYSSLRKLISQEEPNDDLLDAFKENDDSLRIGLITLLKSADGISDEIHQPLQVTYERLARAVSQLPVKPLQDADELYPLMYTPSRSIQQAAFNLLHAHIPATQEQVSFDAALENKAAHLPDELLSLVLEAPTLDSLAEASFDTHMPLPLLGYLSSWRLLFDHFTNSSYRVKSDYIEQLKEGTYLSGLLTFTFDFLGHSRGKPVDVSRFDIENYAVDAEPTPERDVQWLLTHLYYLALMHLPSSVKSYYLDIRSRQTSLAVESWTAKFISPLLITASLNSVSEWAEKSKSDPEYANMSVKVGMRSKEILVGYVVDEQTMAIKVVLPEAYPLASAKVEGVSRVAVKEEKWQSWLRGCQGVITFSVSRSYRTRTFSVDDVPEWINHGWAVGLEEECHRSAEGTGEYLDGTHGIRSRC